VIGQTPCLESIEGVVRAIVRLKREVVHPDGAGYEEPFAVLDHRTLGFSGAAGEQKQDEDGNRADHWRYR
jgi:hypothetical protein